MFWNQTETNVRTCVITNGVEAYCLPQYSSRDIYNRSLRERTVVVAAVYIPTDIKPPQTELEQLIQYCEKDKRQNKAYLKM